MLCMSQNIFKFQNNYFEQTEETDMSNLRPLTNLAEPKCRLKFEALNIFKNVIVN